MSIFGIIVVTVMVVFAFKLTGKATEAQKKSSFEAESDFIDLMEDLDAIDDG